ncbi:MAG: sugar phosphate isomerase/epimerase [Herpetosiphonaceae bacterium]|nr:sugar phosphate isomerase/epimerase [Herpetosiphonaceae bacterium]
MPTRLCLSAFGDEIDADLATQLDVLVSEGVQHLEIRGAWGKNILEFDGGEINRAQALLKERGVKVSAIGSPIGKSQLGQPPAFELERLERAIAAAEAFDTQLIRIFSFFVGENDHDRARPDVFERIARWTERAVAAGVTLVHENEKEIYGDIPQRCQELLEAVNSPALRNAFDPANYVQVGVQPMAQAWPLLADYTTHVHIKDAVFADGSVRPAGEGDGALPALLQALVDRRYDGFLTLEPHLKIAGRFGGTSGEAGMRLAIRALRKLLEPFREQVIIQ